VAGAGATLLRGGIFKLRTDPQSFQGLGLDALDAVREARARTGLGFVAEVTDPRQIEALAGAVDMYQVGARNMHNYDLLKELGRAAKPVLLKRGFCALIEEWLLAARYVTDAGNPDVVLCERGIRTFERATRNTLDLAAVALVKAGSPYPVLVDPSHGTGRPEIVPAMCLAAAAAGADGLMLEVHPEPERALSDGYQALSLGAFAALVPPLESLLGHLGRPLARARQRLAG
jgi:3-deoxy-7-phosphoheptulonate synthase